MTTPNQSPPDGAYVLGGNELHYGQGISEQYAKELWAIPSPTPSNAITMFREALRMAPTGALDAVAGMIPEANAEESPNADDTIGDGIVDNLGETWIQRITRELTSAFEGEDGTGGFFTDLFNAAARNKRELTETAAGLAKLQADLNGNNNSGRTFILTVSEYGTEMPPDDILLKFHDSGVGDIINDGDSLEFQNEDGRELFGYAVEPLLTDYPEVSLVVPRQAASYFGGYGNRNLFWIFRANEDFTSYSIARLNGNKLKVGCVQAGISTIDSPTWFGSGADGSGPDEITISPASYMTARGGYLDDPKVVQFLVNNRVAATFYDSTEASAIDEVHRWTGFGIQNDRNDIVNRVASVSHFMANDNQPTPVQGSGARMSRISTASVNAISGAHALPDNFFGFVNEKTADIAVNLVNGGFIVTEGDWYDIDIRIKVSGDPPPHLQFYAIRNGLDDIYFGPDLSDTSALAVAASTKIYLYGGDSIQMGLNSGSPGALNAWEGEATGFQTHFTISRGRR